MIKYRLLLLVIAMLSLPAHSAPDCPDTQLLSGKLITDICWDCIFPIRIAGVNMFGSAGNVPSGATSKKLCTCQDGNGVIHPGFASSMWEPNSLVELVRTPGCFMSLNGAKINVDSRNRGNHAGKEGDSDNLSFYHYHYYSFPIMELLELVSYATCKGDHYQDIDVIYMSEFDPTWNRDELSFFTFPESAAFANPIAKMACLADAITAANGSPLDSLMWCAGSWGSIYPVAGHANWSSSIIRTTSLLTARAINALHRRGMLRKTMGDANMCTKGISPIMPKSQYKLSMFWPRPEANGSHWIGESTYLWGQWRRIPATGEDHSYVVFRWNDCCMTAL